MEEGTITREQLIGYAREYLYLVRQAPGLVGPALASFHDASEARAMAEFLADEVGHEDLLLGALATVEVSDEPDWSPLGWTEAICASLGVYAAQDLLTFRTVLFLFERPSARFHTAFVKACTGVGLGEGFWRPIVDHAELNQSAHHGTISCRLLATMNAITEEHALTVIAHVVNLVEAMIELERAILDRYSEPSEQ